MRLWKFQELGRHKPKCNPSLPASLPFLVCKPFSFMCLKMFIYHKSKVFHSNDTKMDSMWLREVHKLFCPFPQQEPRVMGSCLPRVHGGHSTLWAVWLGCHHPYLPCGKRTSQPHGRVATDGLCSSADKTVLSGHVTTLSVIGRWWMLNRLPVAEWAEWEATANTDSISLWQSPSCPSTLSYS